MAQLFQKRMEAVKDVAVYKKDNGLWLLFTGRFLTHGGVSVWRTRHVHFNNTRHTPLSIDGRVYHEQTDEVDISILPEEIDFLIM